MSAHQPTPDEVTDAALALQVDALIELVDQRLVELVHDREKLAAQREAEGTP